MSLIQQTTAQNVQLNYQVASVGNRALATIIDFSFFFIYLIVVAIISAITSPWAFVLLGVIAFYSLFCEVVFNGKTAGKHLMKIKVVKMDGSELTFGNCFVRWIFRLIDIFSTSGALAVIFMLFNQKGQRLGDYAANTTVVYFGQDVTIKDIGFLTSEDNHEITFQEVNRLNDNDIAVIQEVIAEVVYKTVAPYSVRLSIAQQTQSEIEKKMGIISKMTPYKFLATVIKDYNQYHLQS